jgi:hypothetical protein
LRERLLSVPKLPLEPCAALPLRLDLGTDLLACLRAIYEVALVCREELSERVDLGALIERSADDVGQDIELCPRRVELHLSLRLAGFFGCILGEAFFSVAKFATLSAAADGTMHRLGVRPLVYLFAPPDMQRPLCR